MFRYNSIDPIQYNNKFIETELGQGHMFVTDMCTFTFTFIPMLQLTSLGCSVCSTTVLVLKGICLSRSILKVNWSCRTNSFVRCALHINSVWRSGLLSGFSKLWVRCQIQFVLLILWHHSGLNLRLSSFIMCSHCSLLLVFLSCQFWPGF